MHPMRKYSAHFVAEVLTRFIQLKPLSASALLTGKVKAVWANLDRTGYIADKVSLGILLTKFH